MVKRSMVSSPTEEEEEEEKVFFSPRLSLQTVSSVCMGNAVMW
jgi:hypothetical protein